MAAVVLGILAFTSLVSLLLAMVAYAFSGLLRLARPRPNEIGSAELRSPMTPIHRFALIWACVLPIPVGITLGPPAIIMAYPAFMGYLIIVCIALKSPVIDHAFVVLVGGVAGMIAWLSFRWIALSDAQGGIGFLFFGVPATAAASVVGAGAGWMLGRGVRMFLRGPLRPIPL